MKQRELLTQQRRTFGRQCLNQVFEHGTQSPGNLDALASEVTDFGDGQEDKIFPIRGPVHESKPARRVPDLACVQMPIAYRAQEVMELVQGEDCRRRIVDGR